MKSKTCGLLVGVLLYGTVLVLGQSKELSGTWVGDTVVPNSTDKDIVTMVLKKAGDSYTGKVSDSLGMLNSAPLEKVTFEKDTLSCEFMVATSEQNIRVTLTLKTSGEKLVGSWVSEDGASGQIEMARVK